MYLHPSLQRHCSSKEDRYSCQYLPSQTPEWRRSEGEGGRELKGGRSEGEGGRELKGGSEGGGRKRVEGRE